MLLKVGIKLVRIHRNSHTPSILDYLSTLYAAHYRKAIRGEPSSNLDRKAFASALVYIVVASDFGRFQCCSWNNRRKY